jgi:hypothetical protein
MKFYNRGKILAGIVIFAVLVTLPFWYGGGKQSAPPALALDTPAILALEDRRCLEETVFMRTNHMKLLVGWRDGVVRDGNRLHTARNGKVYEMSLSGTCLKCHSNKDQFCDRCHHYVGAKPSCWDCHIVPQEVK